MFTTKWILGLITKKMGTKLRQHDSKFIEHPRLVLLCGVTRQVTIMKPGGKKIIIELEHDNEIKPGMARVETHSHDFTHCKNQGPINEGKRQQTQNKGRYKRTWRKQFLLFCYSYTILSICLLLTSAEGELLRQMDLSPNTIKHSFVAEYVSTNFNNS